MTAAIHANSWEAPAPPKTKRRFKSYAFAKPVTWAAVPVVSAYDETRKAASSVKSKIADKIRHRKESELYVTCRDIFVIMFVCMIAYFAAVMMFIGLLALFSL